MDHHRKMIAKNEERIQFHFKRKNATFTQCEKHTLAATLEHVHRHFNSARRFCFDLARNVTRTAIDSHDFNYKFLMTR